MKIEKVYAVYFSPTNGTKHYAEGIARRISAEFQVIDLTRPEVREKSYQFTETDLVILGAPVYVGRLPTVQGGIFDRLQGSNTPAVFTVCYGNRDFDDALLEEKEFLEERGFRGIAASSWIAPHSFSDKIAADRPNGQDEEALDKFAEQLKTVLEGEIPATLTVRGNSPYKKGMEMPFHPAGEEGCVGCGTCVGVCPTGAIDAADPTKTDGSKCINCMACVKACPTHARKLSNPMYLGIVAKLEDNLTKQRQEPEFFF